MIDRRTLLALLPGAALGACATTPPPPPPRTASATLPPKIPPPEPPMVLELTKDGWPTIQMFGLRYAVNPPPKWAAFPARSRAFEALRSDRIVLLVPEGSNPDSSDLMISCEAFLKSERAPTPAQKLENIVAARKKMEPEFRSEAPTFHPLRGGKAAQFYLMRNTPSKESEALAFVDEGHVVAEMLLVAKDRVAFDKALPAFMATLRSYERVT
jgi:hypothetical protein